MDVNSDNDIIYHVTAKSTTQVRPKVVELEIFLSC